MPYSDPEKRKEAQKRYRKRITQGITDNGTTAGITHKDNAADIKQMVKPKGKVGKAEIDALPADVKQSINQLCDSNPEVYNDRQERFVRAALYQRQFPNRGYTPQFTGKLTAFEQEHYKPASELGRGEFNPVSKPGDTHYGVY